MSKQKIIFEGNLCKVIEEKVLYQCTSESMMDAYRSKIPIKTRFMPLNTLYYERREDMKSIYVVCVTPKIARIKWREGEGVNIYRISMPFMYYMVKCDENAGNILSVFPFASKNIVTKEEDNLFVAPISNIYDGGHRNMCTGQIRFDTSMKLTDKINGLMDEIYSSIWNSDLSFTLPVEIESFKDWDEKSLKDALIWTKLTYAEHRYETFGNAITEIFRYNE